LREEELRLFLLPTIKKSIDVMTDTFEGVNKAMGGWGLLV
jgi:hypothetical protein